MKGFTISGISIWFICLLYLTSNGSFAQISGSLDPDFYISPSFGPDDPQYYASAKTFVQIAQDRFVLGGSFRFFSGYESHGLVVLHVTGKVDTTFRCTLTNVYVNRVYGLPGGKILAFGRFTTPAGLETGVVRLMPDGELDASFHLNQNITFVQDGLLLSDGNYILRFSSGLIGFLSNGDHNPAFVTSATMNSPDDWFVIQGDSFILTRPDEWNEENAIRYSKNGTRDTSFHFTNPGQVQRIVPSRDGGLLILKSLNFGSDPSTKGLFKINSKGKTDPTFHKDPNATGTIIHTDESGSFYIQAFRSPIKKYTLNGDPDTTYQSTSQKATGAFLPQNDGKGWVVYGEFNSTRPALMQIDSLGGITYVNQNRGFDGAIKFVKKALNGRFWVVGNFMHFDDHLSPYICRLLPDGRLDTTFHSPFLPGDVDVNYWHMLNASLSASGKLLIAGHFDSVGLHPRNQMVLLNPDGQLNLVFKPQLENISVSAAFFGSNEKIYLKSRGLTGSAQNSHFFRLKADGTQDTGFTTPLDSTDVYNSFSPGIGDALYVGISDGYVTDTPEPGSPWPKIHVLKKIRLNGEEDTSFHFVNVPSGEISRIEEDANGKLVIEYFKSDWGMKSFSHMRVLPNAKIDTGFKVLSCPVSQSQGGAGSFALQENRNVFLYTGGPLCKVANQGLLDASFAAPVFLSGIVSDMLCIDSTGILVAGDFSYVNNQNINRIVKLRLYPDATTALKKEISTTPNPIVVPNPADDEFHFANLKGDYLMEVYNVLGKSLKQQTISSATHISANGLPTGICFYRLSNGNQSWSGKFLIK